MAAADDPLHGQGRRREDVGRRRHRAPLRRGAARARSCSPPIPRTRSPTSLQAPVGAEPTTSATACGPSRSRPRTSSSATGRAVAELARRRCSSSAASDRIAAEELTVPPGGDELFSAAAAQAPRRVRRVGRDRRRLRADRRDAAAALVPRRGALVAATRCSGASSALLAAARPLARAFLDLQLPDERVMAEIQRLVGQPDRDARAAARRLARVAAAGDDARPDGRRRGDAHVHLPEPLRLPDRRRGREPRLPRRAGRRLLRRLARRAGASSSALVESGFAPVPVLRAPYFEQEVLGARCSTGSPSALFAGRDPAARAARPAHAGAALDERAGGAAARPAVRAARATSR